MVSSKTEVAKKNRTFTMAEVERLMNEELERVAQEDWACYVQKICKRKVLQRKRV
jgi:hypothetical protein